MTEEESYEKLQDLLNLVKELVAAGAYSVEEIVDEINAA
jgi:predicted house-cleaning noncanonical NTP pyrophosphatase (MazG superfamily)